MSAPLFSARAVRDLQRLSEASSPCTADIFLPTGTTTGTVGQKITTWGTTPTVGGLPCRVSAQGALSRESVVSGAQATPRDAYLLTFAAGTTISPAAKIRVTGATPTSGGASAPWTLWLAVQGPPQVQTYEAMRRVLCLITDPVAGA